MSFTSLVLTGGRSARMGQPKAWLRLNGEPLLTRLVRLSVQAGAHRVVVVTGSNTDTALVTPALVHNQLPPSLSARVDTAPGHPERSPIDSIRAGLKRVPSSHRLLLWPIDCPFAEAELLTRLINAVGPLDDRIARPAVGTKHGHPIFLGVAAHNQLHSPLADQGAHGVVRRDPARLVDLPTEDHRLVSDLNTPAQAAALRIEGLPR